MEKDDVIRKIKKLMALASDVSASDQEIQLAMYRANKLMIQYKIDQIELYGNQQVSLDDVQEVLLDQKGTGYIYWSFQVLARSFQCATFYRGKFNSNQVQFGLIGLKKDLEPCKICSEGLIYYLNKNIDDLKASYIGDDDFRIFKRDYLTGFSTGLEKQLKQLRLEMKLSDCKELMILDVPAVVNEYFNKNVKTRKASFIQNHCDEALELGEKHGREYQINRTDLLTN